MPSLTIVRFCGDDLSLAEIQTVVRQGEARFGSLLAISPCEVFPPQRLTCFTHEDSVAPAHQIELRVCPGDEVPELPGKSLVCVGACFVESSLRKVAAYR